MNFVKDIDFQKALDRVERLEDLLKNLRGEPIIQGYRDKKFTLNDSLNVLDMKKDINEAKDDIAELTTTVSSLTTTVEAEDSGYLFEVKEVLIDPAIDADGQFVYDADGNELYIDKKEIYGPILDSSYEIMRVEV